MTTHMRRRGPGSSGTAPTTKEAQATATQPNLDGEGRRPHRQDQGTSPKSCEDFGAVPQAAADTAAGLAGAASLAAADPWVVSCWRAAIGYLAGTGRTWTVDDVYELGVPPLDRPGAAGALLSQAAASGRIVPVGRVPSRRDPRRRARVRQWCGQPTGIDIGCGIPEPGQLL